MYVLLHSFFFLLQFFVFPLCRLQCLDIVSDSFLSHQFLGQFSIVQYPLISVVTLCHLIIAKKHKNKMDIRKFLLYDPSEILLINDYFQSLLFSLFQIPCVIHAAFTRFIL
jgi:hypothetical protein